MIRATGVLVVVRFNLLRPRPGPDLALPLHHDLRALLLQLDLEQLIPQDLEREHFVPELCPVLLTEYPALQKMIQR